MIIILGAVLFIMGVVMIAGFFLIGNKDNNSKEQNHKIKQNLTEALRTGNVELAVEINKYLAKGDYEAVNQVVDELDSYDTSVQEAIRSALAESQLMEQYKEGIKANNYKERAISLERFAKIGGKEVTVVLFEAMADKNDEVRLVATNALKKLADPELAKMLVAALKEPNKWLPARVAEVLVSLGKDAVPALKEAIHDNDPVFRGYIIEMLGEIGDKSSLESLYAALIDNNSSNRLKVVRAISQIGDPESVGFLLKMLDDPENKVKVQAIRGLGKIGGADTIANLEPMLASEDKAVMYTAMEALRQHGKEGMNIIEKVAFTDSHPAMEKAKEILKETGHSANVKVNIGFEQTLDNQQ